MTLLLTAGIVVLACWSEVTLSYWAHPRGWIPGLIAFGFLFDIYTLYQHLLLQRLRRRVAHRDHLFHLITENAADMIAVVDEQGRRLYNSPAYMTVLGYSMQELLDSSPFDWIHPLDRERVQNAAELARCTGKVQRLEYRMKHKDGSWRVLESTANVILSSSGKMEGLVIVNRDITERKRAEDLLAHTALHDGLTDLPNRALFADRLQHALQRSRRHGDYKFVVLYIDIDEFKVVNDSLGRHAGDKLLVQVSERLASCFRDSDMVASGTPSARDSRSAESVARLGGDEFTVLLEDIVQPSDAVRVAERIQHQLSRPFEIEGRALVVTASIGAALNSTSYDRPEDLLRDAEIAMHRAKRSGKACCQVFDPVMHANAVRRLQLETDLRRGIELGEMLVYYQPIIGLCTDRIVGFEALSRWRQASGLVFPAEFIPIADETGLVLRINRALLGEACRQLRVWQSRFPSDPPLSISANVAPRQFLEPELAEKIGEVLRETGLNPAHINLEIMETIAMGESNQSIAVLSKLKSLGVRLSIDDFGTGYSSLSRLPLFPIDTLKIDGVFVANLSSDHNSREVVKMIIQLAHGLGLKVVAERVEHQDQVNILKNLNCDMAQGFFYSPAIDPATASALLDEQPAPKSIDWGQGSFFLVE
jgi:PAS domain S-box-containing protein